MDLEHETTSVLLQKLENKYNHSATLLDKNIEDQRVELINAISDLTTKMDDRYVKGKFICFKDQNSKYVSGQTNFKFLDVFNFSVRKF